MESSDEESKLLNISLSHLRGRTNEELLASLLEKLSAYYSIEELSLHTGFQMDELNRLLPCLNADSELITPVQESHALSLSASLSACIFFAIGSFLRYHSNNVNNTTMLFSKTLLH